MLKMEANIQLENLISEPTDIDLMICGSCKRTFQLANILGFMKHKKFDCEDPGNLADPKNKTLLCQACHQKFNTPWSLLKHAQNVHFLQIYLEQNYNIQSLHVREEHISKSPLRVDDNSLNESLPRKIHTEVKDGSRENLLSMEPNMKDVKYSSEQTSVCQDATGDQNTEDQVALPGDGSKKQEHSSVQAVVEDSTVKDTSESATQTSVKTSTTNDGGSKEAGSSNDDQKCCDDQDCGITVMPGTHESLKKCCSAVVPKKRKRHMEIKHRTSALARLRRQRNRSNSPASIFIDLAPDGDGFTSPNFNVEQPTTSLGKANAKTISADSINQQFYPSAKQKSVIIQPGSTFSIPVSYAADQLPPAIQIIGPKFQKSMSPGSSGKRQLSKTQIPLVRDPPASTILNTHAKSPNSVVLEAGQNSTSSDIDSKNTLIMDVSPDPSLIKGIINQIFSEKMITDTQTMETIQLGSVQQDTGVMNDDPGGTLSEPSDRLHPLGRVISGKKRRYPTSRPFKCEQCGDAFNQRIHLKKHQSKHTGIKPFKCDQCDYATVERSHLKVHIRVHTGEKPFKCTYCEYATAQKSTLKIHLKRHHATTEHCFQCPHRDNTHCFPNLEQAHLLLYGNGNDSMVTMEDSPQSEVTEDKPNIALDVSDDMTQQPTDHNPQ